MAASIAITSNWCMGWHNAWLDLHEMYSECGYKDGVFICDDDAEQCIFKEKKWKSVQARNLFMESYNYLHVFEYSVLQVKL